MWMPRQLGRKRIVGSEHVEMCLELGGDSSSNAPQSEFFLGGGFLLEVKQKVDDDGDDDKNHEKGHDR